MASPSTTHQAQIQRVIPDVLSHPSQYQVLPSFSSQFLLNTSSAFLHPHCHPPPSKPRHCLSSSSSDLICPPHHSTSFQNPKSSQVALQSFQCFPDKVLGPHGSPSPAFCAVFSFSEHTRFGLVLLFTVFPRPVSSLQALLHLYCFPSGLSLNIKSSETSLRMPSPPHRCTHTWSLGAALRTPIMLNYSVSLPHQIPSSPGPGPGAPVPRTDLAGSRYPDSQGTNPPRTHPTPAASAHSSGNWWGRGGKGIRGAGLSDSRR